MCYNNCPQVEFDVEKMEKHVFGRTRTEEEQLTGVYKAAYAVRSVQEDIKGQDGGVVKLPTMLPACTIPTMFSHFTF